MKISVIGLGKAGLPLASVIADSGFDVIGLDIDAKRVDAINKGINPILEESGLSMLVKKHGGKKLFATSNFAEIKAADAHIVIVPLFINNSKKPDFSILKAAFESVGKYLKRNDLVVLETTVPVGTTENLVKDILEKSSKMKAGADFFLAYSPERIMTGYSISRFREFPKLVGGINDLSTEAAFKLYSKFAKPIKVSNSRTAELAKIAEGVYRDVNIAVANELFKISEKYKVDFWEMREAAKHQYCNILEPGNVGGHCIPVYPWFLINDNKAELLLAARNVNDDMIEYYAEKIAKIAKKGNVAVVGLSYREGVKEKAYSRSVAIIRLLKDKGYKVYGIDPLYSKNETESEFGIKYLDDFAKMDAIILMNKNIEYKKELSKMKNKVVDVKKIL